MRREAFAGLVVLAAAVAARAADEPTPAGVAFFEKKVRPVLVEHCYKCHGPDEKKVRGELRLDTRAGVLKGGQSGPAVVPGDPAKSLLVTAVRHTDDALKMPPKEKLPAEAIAALEAWVKMGVPDPRTATATKSTRLDLAGAKDFWAFKPVAKPEIPFSRDAKRNANPVDAFVLAKLRDKGLSPAPPADKRTLIRRATFDLTGLPPTPGEIDAFLGDESPEAFAKVVDRLLASPAYGERWGRHWLDVVRYADTAGDNSDYPVPQMYRYRNWVIDAFNRDLPYDEFVRQQLAGDLLPAKSEEDRRDKLIATGYLANARRFGSYEDARYPWYLTYEDTIDNLGRTFLGLTVGCARCHDHKFDPVSQEDYYALYGFFSSTRYPRPGIELDKVQRDFVPLGPAGEITAVLKDRDRRLADLDARVRKLTADKAANTKALAGAESIPDGDERKAVVTELNREAERLKGRVKAAQTEAEKVAREPLPFETAYAVAEGKTEGKKKVGNACVQIKGDPERPGKEVPRRFLEVLGGQTLPTDAAGSGRLELVNWIADPKNPLTARVLANRVWHYHFGKGLVPTPNNFGTLGLPPTHPELLDYLAAEFVSPTTRFSWEGEAPAEPGGVAARQEPRPPERRAWSIKRLHRLVMLSRVYQQSSRDDAANAKIDISNDYLWRFDRRRLDAESIRDALLAVGGNLDRTPGGPHPFPEMKAWNYTQHNPFKAVYDSNKRSVYLMTQRIQRHPFLALFDGADTNASTDRRVTSTTPLQALFLMNDPLVHEQAKRFAARVMSESKDDESRIGRAFVLLYGRPPTADETAAATEYLAKAAAKLGGSAGPAAAWESLARALFLSNEFVYVD